MNKPQGKTSSPITHGPSVSALHHNNKEIPSTQIPQTDEKETNPLNHKDKDNMANDDGSSKATNRSHTTQKNLPNWQHRCHTILLKAPIPGTRNVKPPRPSITQSYAIMNEMIYQIVPPNRGQSSVDHSKVVPQKGPK